MGARFFVLLCHTFFTYGLTLNRHSDQHSIISKSKVELTPLFASTRLNDIIILSAPIINAKDVHYYLNKPNGDAINLDIKRKTKNLKTRKYLGNDILEKHIKEGPKAVVKPLDNLEIFNVQFENFTDRERRMDVNDFALGPLTEEDHGNWVLSVYYEDLDGDWIELFQVITVKIVEIIPPVSQYMVLDEGAVFRPSFAYPIKGLESCELIAPSSTIDRLYDRSRIEFSNCEYVVENVTKLDEGIWSIIAVGRIIYETKIQLTVLNRVT